MPTAKVTEKGQITIPAQYRAEPFLREGDDVLFREENGKIVIETTRNVVHDLVGSLSEYAKGKPTLTDELIDRAVEQGVSEDYRRKLADSE